MYFELLLNANKLEYQALHRYLLDPNEKKPEKNIELYEYLDNIKNNLNLHTQIVDILILYNSNFIRTSHAENRIYTQLIDLSRGLFPSLNATETISSLLSVFFIQALTSFSKLSPLEGSLVWKSRYEVIAQITTLLRQFLLQLELTTGTSIRIEPQIKTFIWVLLQTLINSGVLTARTKFVAKHKSEVFVAGVGVRSALKNSSILKLIGIPANTIQIHNTLFLQAPHYSLLQKVVRPNNASHKKPRIANLNFLHSRLHMRLYIDWGLFTEVVHLVKRYFKIDLNDIETLLCELAKFKASWWNKEAQAQYAQYYKLLYLYILQQQKNQLLGGFYFHYYFDFRGRIYADSPVSYTFNKTTRGLFYYGEYNSSELADLQNTIPMVGPILDSFVYPRTTIKLQYPTIDYANPLIQYYIYIVFFELGKLKKNQHINQYEGKLAAIDFIHIGVEYFNNPPKEDLDFEDHVEYLAIKNILNWINQNIFIKIPVYKDATASALQLLLALLGPANSKILYETNLKSSGFWYDTYFSIIERFYKTHNLPPNLKEKYFTRAALKKTIMTHNYQATYLTCLNEFKQHNSLPWNNEDPANLVIIPFFKKFYEYLNHLFDSNEFFFVSSYSIVQWFKKSWEENQTMHFITLDNLYIPLEYVKLTKQRVERLILTKRETILWVNLSDEIDEAKMFRAVRANLIHSFDGYLIRRITLKLGHPIITIHDCFGIDILNTPRLLKITQEEITQLGNLNIFAPKTQNFHADSEFILL